MRKNAEKTMMLFIFDPLIGYLKHQLFYKDSFGKNAVVRGTNLYIFSINLNFTLRFKELLQTSKTMPKKEDAEVILKR